MLTEKQQAMELYPIGTQLVIKQLSQAALADELGFIVASSFDDGVRWYKGLYPVGIWRITVTADNQAALSPVPMVGDTVEHKHYAGGIIVDTIKYLKDDCFMGYSMEEPELISLINRIVRRNGHPLPQFDEAIYPEVTR